MVPNAALMFSVGAKSQAGAAAQENRAALSNDDVCSAIPRLLLEKRNTANITAENWSYKCAISHFLQFFLSTSNKMDTTINKF